MIKLRKKVYVTKLKRFKARTKPGKSGFRACVLTHHATSATTQTFEKTLFLRALFHLQGICTVGFGTVDCRPKLRAMNQPHASLVCSCCFFLFEVQLTHTTSSLFGEPFHIFQSLPEYQYLTKSSWPPIPPLLNCSFTSAIIAFPANLYFL